MNTRGKTMHATRLLRGGLSRSGRKGFTLVEVLIVVSIILLLAVLLIPSFADFLDGRKLRAGAAKIESAILRAKSEAIRSRQMHYVVFDRFNHRVALVNSGLNRRADLESVEMTGELVFDPDSDDIVVAMDPSQRSLPSGVFLARTDSDTSDSALLFSEQIRCYPDGSIITAGRPDVPTTTYLDGANARGDVGGDIVISLIDPVWAPNREADDLQRGCFIDITPTTGRIRYEIDTWLRDYHGDATLDPGI